MRSILIPFLVLLSSCSAAPSIEADLSAATSELEVVSTGDYVRIDFELGDVASRLVYAPDALPRRDRRLVALIPGTLANGAGYYDVASGTGYNAAELLADEGFFALLVDLPGTAGSYHPTDGRSVRVEQAAAAVLASSAIVAPLLGVRHGVDVYGETGLGSNVALLLARSRLVRSVVIPSAFYQQFGPAMAPVFDPSFRALLDSIPGGYLPQDPAQIGGALYAASPAIAPLALAGAMGPAPQIVPSGVYYDLFDASGPSTATTLRLARPVVRAEPARADALIVQGSPDFVGSEPGTAELAAAYGASGGGSATLVTIPGATHLMRFDAATSDGPASPLWSAVLDFLEAH